MEIQFGKYELTITVELVEAIEQPEVTGAWLRGQVSVSGCETHYQSAHIGFDDLTVGCWTDTDDDEDSWAADMEGARVLSQLASGKEPDGTFDVDPGNWRGMFQAECEEIGGIICAALREQHAGVEA